MDKCFDCKINKRIKLEDKIKENEYEITYEYTSYFCERCYKNYPVPTAIEIFDQMKTKKCIGCELNERFLIKFSDDEEIYENYSFFCKRCLDDFKPKTDEINCKLEKELEFYYFPEKITRSINFKPKPRITIKPQSCWIPLPPEGWEYSKLEIIEYYFKEVEIDGFPRYVRRTKEELEVIPKPY